MFNSKEKAPELVKLMQEGATIAEISDAGMPVISDPGYILVQECIKNNVQVDYFPYPCAEHNVFGKDRVHLMDKVTMYFEDYL